jgi:hypothetical protein
MMGSASLKANRSPRFCLLELTGTESSIATTVPAGTRQQPLASVAGRL